MPIVLGPKYAVRISTLQADFALQFGCMFCGHVSIMPATFFMARYEPHLRIIDIEHKFCCGKCGNKIENHWTVVKQVRQDQPKAPAAAISKPEPDTGTGL